jgi:hypothetical protein
MDARNASQIGSRETKQDSKEAIMPGMMEMMDGMPMWPFGPLMMLVFAALIILPFWFIFAKAGFPAWLSVLMVVPVVNLIMLYILAFSAWPNLREMKSP